MNIKQFQQDNLHKALGLFIEAMRPYIISVLSKEAGKNWEKWFKEVLFPDQLEHWNRAINEGSSPEALIDYPYLKPFALKYRELLKNDFERDTNKLPTYFETLNEVRNKFAHFQVITEDEFNEAFIITKNIARKLQMNELEEALNLLQQNKEKKQTQTASPKDVLPWYEVVSPHLDIKKGHLDESIFAANLSEVAHGNGREIYNNPIVFFSKTYFTAGLKNVAKTVIKGLNGDADANDRVISLQTGFGGGKTHTLISLYHLSRWGNKAKESSYAEELLHYTGIPKFESANIAVFTNTTNDVSNGRKTDDGIHIRTIWGEIAYQLGGKEAYEIIRKNDEEMISPGGQFKKILHTRKPSLILIDELADYCVKASAKQVGSSSLADQTISFMQELTEAIATENHCVAVITLPASKQEVGNTAQAGEILVSLEKRVARVGADTQPVADEEIFEVIRRRLFETIGDEQTIQQIINKYADLYNEYWTELSDHATKIEYKQKMLKSYPFHPELIDIFRIRWASHHNFQRTRGVLRLLAAIVSDLWNNQNQYPGPHLLIHSGDVNFKNLDALSGQLKKLYGNGYDAVMSADVAGTSSNAYKIDKSKQEFGKWRLTQSISSVVLLHSFGSEGINKGISIPEIKLNLLAPGGVNHNSINSALDELENKAYYLHYVQSSGIGKRYWFHTKANINILINQAKGDIKTRDTEAEVINRMQMAIDGKAGRFNIIIDPSEDIPEQKKPALFILNPTYLANPDHLDTRTQALITKIATKKGNSERIYRNTILFLLCSEIGIAQLRTSIHEYLACKKVMEGYESKLEPDQKEDIKERIKNSKTVIENQLAVCYSIIAKHTAQKGVQLLHLKSPASDLKTQIEINIYNLLNEEEWLLESIGLQAFKKHNLLPSSGDPRKVRDIYEAFIRYDDKPMIVNETAVSQSLLRYCINGEFCIAVGDGKEFKTFFYKQNVPFFDISDDTYWLTDVSERPSEEAIKPEKTEEEKPEGDVPSTIVENGATPPEENKALRSIVVSGKVPLEHYTDLFGSFISPFSISGNKIEINIKFKIKSTEQNPITKNSPQYKSAKESALQLGLEFKEE